MRFKVTHNDIDALSFEDVGLFQHLVRLADAGCVAHEHL